MIHRFPASAKTFAALLIPLALTAQPSHLAGQSAAVTLGRVALDGLDAEAKTVPLELSAVWADPSRDGERYDALWVFAKFEREPGVWGDLRLRSGSARVGDDSPLAVREVLHPSGYARGLVLYRGARGAGPTSVAVTADWDFGASYFDRPTDSTDVRVYGVELVHVPPGAFALGEDVADSLRQPNAFRAAGGGAFRLASEGELAVGDAAGALTYDVPEGESYAGGDVGGPVPPSFPKGVDGFYVMKYPVTQGQYAAFLNALPPRGRRARDVSAYPNYRERGGSIRCDGAACVAAYPDRAANFLTWADGTGWAAWAGLRPMTELEYEKAAAGTAADSARYADGALPDRVGSSRRRSRWGAVDLRGGLWERVVSIGTPEGRAYRGSPGPGFVDELGYPYAFANADWPGPRAVGSGYRGGTEGLLDLSEVADRTYGAYEATYGDESQGFRAVLDLPTADAAE